ncbi:hypothetical protein CEXT_733641 [Caerostris extrusa]|uniref:Uncharacterized protein n=1 Tax=Caerostris extrusa TaxID=172846 RepID=A0AAV4U1R7_CAEEX|nr:hypothetical protein CEXT_733641 [Caerostris extrusa]
MEEGKTFAFYEKSFVFSFCTSPDVKANHNRLISPMIDGTWNGAREKELFMGGKNGMTNKSGRRLEKFLKVALHFVFFAQQSLDGKSEPPLISVSLSDRDKNEETPPSMKAEDENKEQEGCFW